MYTHTRTFEKFVWITQTEAVIGVLHCDWFPVWTRGSQFIWLKTDKLRIKDWKPLVLPLSLTHTHTPTHTHTRTHTHKIALQVPDLLSISYSSGRCGVGNTYDVVCQIIRQLETAPARRLECSCKSVKLDLCDGRICRSTLHLHFYKFSWHSHPVWFSRSFHCWNSNYVSKQQKRYKGQSCSCLTVLKWWQRECMQAQRVREGNRIKAQKEGIGYCL